MVTLDENKRQHEKARKENIAEQKKQGRILKKRKKRKKRQENQQLEDLDQRRQGKPPKNKRSGGIRQGYTNQLDKILAKAGRREVAGRYDSFTESLDKDKSDELADKMRENRNKKIISTAKNIFSATTGIGLGKDNQTEQQKAEKNKQGAPMQGVTGGSQAEESPSSPQSQLPQQNQEQEGGGPAEAGDKNQPSQPGAQATGGQTPAGNQQANQPQTRLDTAKQAASRQQQKVSRSEKKVKASENKTQEQKGRKRSLAQRKLKDRKKTLARRKKRLSKLQAVVGAQAGTAHILKLAWLNLIDSIGITYLYIVFHFLAAYFTPFSNMFCKFGEEWVPKQVGKAGGPAAKSAYKGLEIVEVAGCILIGLLLLIIILMVVAIIGVIVWVAVYPEETVKLLFGTWGVIWYNILHFFGAA